MAEKQKVLVELYFDVISPYTWIAFEALCRYRQVWPIRLELIPFSLRGIMKDTGNRPPGLVAAKARYMVDRDLVRNRSYWDVPIIALKDAADSMFVKGSILAQRFLMALKLHHPAAVEKAARELWMRRWGRDQDIHLPEHIQQVCNAIGIDGQTAERLVEESQSNSVKQLLRTTTDEAVESGAFGAPWIVVHTSDGEKHGFFGSDRFPIIAELIEEPFPGPLRELSAFKGASKY